MFLLQCPALGQWIVVPIRVKHNTISDVNKLPLWQLAYFGVVCWGDIDIVLLERSLLLPTGFKLRVNQCYFGPFVELDGVILCVALLGNRRGPLSWSELLGSLTLQVVNLPLGSGLGAILVTSGVWHHIRLLAYTTLKNGIKKFNSNNGDDIQEVVLSIEVLSEAAVIGIIFFFW